MRVAQNLPGCISKLCTIPFTSLSSPAAYYLRAALTFILPNHQRPSHGMLVVVVVAAVVVVVVAVVVVAFIQTEHPSLNFDLTPFFRR